MRDAVGEEYKHFSMDLEFLLRRTPIWREIAQGILFKAGDIVEHGEAAEEAATEGNDGGRPRRSFHRRHRLAGYRQPEERRGMSNHLLRSHAPISDGNWKLLDDEARERLGAALAARKLVDFLGPFGWEYSSTNLGRVAAVAATPCDGVTGLQRRVLPLVEVRADFALSRSELRDDDRGAEDADLEPLDIAAHQIAVAENKAVFHGWPEASIAGHQRGLARIRA